MRFVLAFVASFATGIVAFAAVSVVLGGATIGSVIAMTFAALFPWLATAAIVYVPVSLGLARWRGRWGQGTLALVGVLPAAIPVFLFDAEQANRLRVPSFTRLIDFVLLVTFAVAGAVFLCVARALEE
jgi:hypothetical protein